MSIKQAVQSAIKDAMKAKDKPRLEALRLISAAVKQKEVDERIEVDDAMMLVILDKMLKQRKESVIQYTEAGRDDLAEKENNEIKIIQEFLPAPLTETEINELIAQAIEETQASSVKDLGKVMGIIKPKVQGRADMTEISKMLKARLGG